MVRRTFDDLATEKRPKTARSPLELGDKRLYTIQKVRAMLDDRSREPFADFLALLLGAHPTEQNVLDFANRNPDKWSAAVSTFSKLTGYREEIEITHNIYALVRTMSDMDLEHQLRALQSQIGDSYLIDPAEIETPFTKPHSQEAAIKRISRG